MARMNVKRPFEIRDTREVYWVRQWLKHQISTGRLPELSYQAADLMETPDDARRLIDRYLDPDSRKRLQKALSARRAREAQRAEGYKSPAVRPVVTELTEKARDMLLAVAAAEGVTTSQLLIDILSDRYWKIAK